MGRGRMPGGRLLKLTLRLLPPDVREHVVRPTLADYQVEWLQASGPASRARARLRGTYALARVLLPALLHAGVLHLHRNAWATGPEDREAARRLAVRGACATLVVMAALLIQQVLNLPVRLRFEPGDAFLLVPAASCIAIPVGCLLGAALARRRAGAQRVHWRPVLSMAALAGLVNFAIAGWLTPQANQAFRQLVFARIASAEHRLALVRGTREMTFVELGARGHELAAGTGTEAARRTAVEWHKKPALGAACLGLAIAGAVLAVLLRSGAGRVALAVLLAGTYLVALRVAEQAAVRGTLPAGLAMWAPPGLVVTSMLLALRLHHRHGGPIARA
jgi:Lipopolysaccharide export system permease LptF/LptG